MNVSDIVIINEYPDADGVSAWALLTLTAGTFLSAAVWFVQRYYTNKRKSLYDKLQIVDTQLKQFYWPLYFGMSRFVACKKHYKAFRAALREKYKPLESSSGDVVINIGNDTITGTVGGIGHGPTISNGLTSLKRARRVSVDESMFEIVRGKSFRPITITLDANQSSTRTTSPTGDPVVTFVEAAEAASVGATGDGVDGVGPSSQNSMEEMHVLGDHLSVKEYTAYLNNTSPEWEPELGNVKLRAMLEDSKACFRKQMIDLLKQMCEIITQGISMASPDKKYGSMLLELATEATVCVALEDCNTKQTSLTISAELIEMTFARLKRAQKRHNQISAMLH